MTVFGGSDSADSDSEAEAEGELAYLKAIGDVGGAAKSPPPPRPPRAPRAKLTALQKRERRRAAQKRITREQQQRIRLREEAHVEACAERDAEEAEREAWQKKMRKIQAEAFGQAGSDDDMDGVSMVHPTCAGLKMRRPAEYSRLYPAFTHPSFGGYKRAKPSHDTGMSRAARAARATHPLKNGGVLSVLCVGCRALCLPKAARGGDPVDLEGGLAGLSGVQQGATQYARVRLGDAEKACEPSFNRKVGRLSGAASKGSKASKAAKQAAKQTAAQGADCAFEVGDNSWLMWDVGPEQDVRPHTMTVMVYSSGRRVGEADVNWVPLIGLHEAESESKDGLATEVPLKDRRGRPCGAALLRLRFKRRAHSIKDAGTSVKEMDVLGGFAMVFDSPPPRANRWDARTDDVPCVSPADPRFAAMAAADAAAAAAAAGLGGGGASDDDDDGDDGDDSSVDDERGAEESVLKQMLHARKTSTFGRNDDGDDNGDGFAGGRLKPGQRPDVGAHASAFAVPGAAHRTRLSAAEEARYAAGMMVHPSVWGYQLTPLVSHDAARCHPVFFDYYLKLGDDAELDRLGPEAQRDAHAVVQFKAKPGMPAGDCPVCFTTDVPGCPSCWQFGDPGPIMRRVLASGGAAGKRAHVTVDGVEAVDPRKAQIDFDDPDIGNDELQVRTHSLQL